MLMVAGAEWRRSKAITDIVKSVIDGSLGIVSKNERVPNRFHKPGTRFFICCLLMSGFMEADFGLIAVRRLRYSGIAVMTR